MKKALIFTSIGLLTIAILVGVSLSNQKKSDVLVEENNDIKSSIEQSLPWLEIVGGKIYELDTDELTIRKELLTGDYILEGMILKTDVLGKAIVHYPDGSELRLEKETLVKFETGSFDTENDSLRVQVELVIGRVWSKIIELATPDSQWEVKTSNAVATVRGTAFGMEADVLKKTKIIGSENAVQISVRNEKTKSLAKTDFMVTKDKVVEINDDVAEKVLALKKTDEEKISGTAVREIISERSTAAADFNDGWIKESENRDDKIRAKIQDLNNQQVDKQEIRDILREDLRKEYQDKTEQTKEVIIERLMDSPAADSSVNKPIIDRLIKEREIMNSKLLPISNDGRGITEEDVKNTEQTRESLIERGATDTAMETSIKEPIINKTIIEEPAVNDVIQVRDTASVKPQTLPTTNLSTPKLEVVTKTLNLNIVEGTEIQFFAYLVMSDGTRKDVTSAVNWSVIGNMGKIDRSGRFLAKIGLEDSDSESSLGSVMANLINTNGSVTKGFSKLITVTHDLSNEVMSPLDIGGQ